MNNGRPESPDETDVLAMSIDGAELGPPGGEYRDLRLGTSRGTVHGRYYPAPAARDGVVWVGGAGGGWDSPALGLYPELCRELTADHIASLRVRFRMPSALEE